MEMKLLLGLILISFSSCDSQLSKNIGKSQNEDSLYKYSYLLPLTKKGLSANNYNIIGLGTGFFLRDKKDIYLVSANHVFTGNDPIRAVRVDSTSPDLMFFYYWVKGSSEKRFINIYLDSIKSANPPKLITKSPDILAYKMNLPVDADINSIEGFINNKITLKENDSLFFWGFPSQQPTIDSSIRFYLRNPNPVKYKGSFIQIIDSLNYMATPTVNFGASGSPVFVKRNLDGIDKLYFIGVLSAASDQSNISFIVTYKELLKQISKQ